MEDGTKKSYSKPPRRRKQRKALNKKRKKFQTDDISDYDYTDDYEPELDPDDSSDHCLDLE